LAIAKTKSIQLADLKLSDNPLILGAEHRKPGNIVVLYCELLMHKSRRRDNCQSKWFIQSNIVRSSVGCLYKPNCHWDNDEIIAFERKKISIVPLYKIRHRIILRLYLNRFGRRNETTGLTQEWRDAATKTSLSMQEGNWQHERFCRSNINLWSQKTTGLLRSKTEKLLWFFHLDKGKIHKKNKI
jgi:TrmH family RNA methyltransferase